MFEINLFSHVEMFLLILMRVSGFLIAGPVFSSQYIPKSILVLFALSLSVFIAPLIGGIEYTHDIEVVFLVIRELFIGLSLGLIARFFIYAASIFGEIVSVSIGLSGAQIFDPTHGNQVSVMGKFKVLLASLIFLSINGHHLAFSAFVKTYDVLPIQMRWINVSNFLDIKILMSEFMIFGVKMSAPILVTIFLLNVTMGIVGRAIPQINVLITSLPVNILVGFCVLFAAIPFFIEGFADSIELAIESAFLFVKHF